MKMDQGPGPGQYYSNERVNKVKLVPPKINASIKIITRKSVDGPYKEK